MKIPTVPITLKPEIYHHEERREAVRDAIAAINQSGEPIPEDWFLELHFLNARIAALKAREKSETLKNYTWTAFPEQ